MTDLLLLGDVALALHDLILTLVGILALVILVYVLLDLARTFVAALPEPVIAIHEGLGKLCEPLFMPARRVLPPMGGIDFAPLVTLLVIQIGGRFIAQLLI